MDEIRQELFETLLAALNAVEVRDIPVSAQRGQYEDLKARMENKHPNEDYNVQDLQALQYLIEFTEIYSPDYYGDPKLPTLAGMNMARYKDVLADEIRKLAPEEDIDLPTMEEVQNAVEEPMLDGGMEYPSLDEIEEQAEFDALPTQEEIEYVKAEEQGQMYSEYDRSQAQHRVSPRQHAEDHEYSDDTLALVTDAYTMFYGGPNDGGNYRDYVQKDLMSVGQALSLRSNPIPLSPELQKDVDRFLDICDIREMDKMPDIFKEQSWERRAALLKKPENSQISDIGIRLMEESDRIKQLNPDSTYAKDLAEYGKMLVKARDSILRIGGNMEMNTDHDLKYRKVFGEHLKESLLNTESNTAYGKDSPAFNVISKYSVEPEDLADLLSTNRMVRARGMINILKANELDMNPSMADVMKLVDSPAIQNSVDRIFTGTEPTAVQIHLNAAPYFNHIFKHLQMKQDQLINGLNAEVDRAAEQEFAEKEQQKRADEAKRKQDELMDKTSGFPENQYDMFNDEQVELLSEMFKTEKSFTSDSDEYKKAKEAFEHMMDVRRKINDLIEDKGDMRKGSGPEQAEYNKEKEELQKEFQKSIETLDDTMTAYVKKVTKAKDGELVGKKGIKDMWRSGGAARLSAGLGILRYTKEALGKEKEAEVYKTDRKADKKKSTSFQEMFKAEYGGSHENEKARTRARSQAAEKALENEKKSPKK